MGVRRKIARALRMYEYVDDNGVVFWSFTYIPGRTTQRLMLLDNRGVHFRKHIGEIHRYAFEKERIEDEG